MSWPAHPPPGALLLTVTRACDLRCAYCPTAKDGWPSLSPDDAVRAVSLFARYGGGDVKIFGGEPLLVPDVVGAVLDACEAEPAVRRVQLSTNGLGLTPAWLDRLQKLRKSVLQVSMDGGPDDHRGLRRALPGAGDAYDHLVGLLPRLLRHPRLVITQTIAPSTAARAADNLRHLLGLGFHRFNLLPGYYIPWRPPQLAALAAAFSDIEVLILESWASGQPFSLRNLFVSAPTPFFNTGLVVDSDGAIYASNLILSGAFEHLREQTRAGTLDDPPAVADLAARASETNALLQSALPPRVWASTLAVDQLLTRLCRRLWPRYLAMRAARARAVA